MGGNRQRELDYKERAEEMMSDAYWDGYNDGRDDTGVKRFRRNKIDGVVGGVCAGIADYTGIDAIIVRISFLAAVLFLGFPLFIYFLLWILVPSDKRAPYRREAREALRAERRAERQYERASRAVERMEPSASLTDVRSKFRSLESRMQDLEKNITSKEWQLRREFRDLEK